MPRRTSRLAVLTTVLTTVLTAVLTAVLATAVGALTTALPALASPAAAPVAATAVAAKAGNPVTPGSFTGYGFDQCLAPEQYKMDAWLASSPFRAVGIYISGDSRGCRSQPNLSPTWVATQLANGWRLLPITLGPQAACNPSFPRYGNDPVIDTKLKADGTYNRALKQGADEAAKAVAAAQALGIVPGSTLWYDLEGYDNTNTSCRESALAFMSAWTQQLHALGYVSGVYSSAGSGIKALDDARVERPGAFALPDQVWIARWDGQANTSTSYIREDGWRPGGRMKQYQGGHNETWGGVTINIDRNYLELGVATAPAPPAASHCNGQDVDLDDYPRLKAPTRGTATSDAGATAALKCFLKEAGLFKGKTKGGAWTGRLTKGVKKWQHRHGLRRTAMVSRGAWVVMLSAGATPTLGPGSAGEDVRRVQRALTAASRKYDVSVTGSYDTATDAAVRAWQAKHGLPVGPFGPESWAALQGGKR